MPRNGTRRTNLPETSSWQLGYWSKTHREYRLSMRNSLESAIMFMEEPEGEVHALYVPKGDRACVAGVLDQDGRFVENLDAYKARAAELDAKNAAQKRREEELDRLMEAKYGNTGG